MSVLSVAQESKRAQGTTSPNPPGEESSSNETKQIDLAQKLSDWTEDFVSGFVPADVRVSINWGLASSLLSALSSTLAAVGFAWRYL